MDSVRLVILLVSALQLSVRSEECVSGGSADNACALTSVILVEPSVIIDPRTCDQDFAASTFAQAPRVFYSNAQSASTNRNPQEFVPLGSPIRLPFF